MSDFDIKSNDIKLCMLGMHNQFKSGTTPTDKDIAILANKFYERDKRSDGFDLEIIHVIRGFEWGMKAMRQIIEGVNLEPNE